MVQNPFADGGLSVKISGDSSGLESTLSSAKSKLGDFRTEVGLAGAAIGTAFVGGVAKSVEAASDWEDVMADVEKVTDAETAEELSGRFQDLSEEIPIAASELATIGEQAGKFGAEGSDEIMSFVETVGKIQTATDLTAEEAGKRFSKIAGAVGMPLDEVGKLGNATNALADSMKTDAGEITDTATRSANVLSQQLGLGEDAVLSMSASMNEVSPSSRQAASSLKRAAKSMMDPKKVGDLASALSLTPEQFREMRDEDPQGLMDDISSAMADNGETANDLRGILGKAATDFSKLGGQLDTTAEAQATANDQFEDGTSLQEEMEIRANTFSASLQMVKQRFANLATSVGERVLPLLKDFLDAVVDGVEFLSALNERLDGALVAGALGTAFTAMAAGAWVAVPAIWAMVAPLLPLAAALAGVGVAVGGLYYAVQNNVLGLGDIFDSVMGAIGDAVAIAKGVIDDFVTFVTLLLEGDFGEAFAFAKDAVKSGIEGAATWLKESAIPALKSAIGTLVDGTISAFNSIVDKSKQVVTDAIGAVVEWVTSIGKDDVKAAFEALGSGIRTVVLTYIGLYKKVGKLFLNFISDLSDYLKNDAKGDVKRAIEAIGAAILAAFTATVEALTPPDGLIVDLITDIATYLKEDAVGDIKAAIGAVIDVVIAAFEGLYTGLIGGSLIPDLFEDITTYIYETAKGLVVGAVEAVVDSIMGTFEDWYDNVIGAGGLVKDLFGAVADYISGTAAGDLVSATADAARAAANAFIDKFNQVMPSSVPIPTVTVGGGTIPNPVPGRDDFQIGTASLGGGDWGMPQLDEGGYIESSGLAQLHAGETVVPAEVSRASGGDTYVDGIDVHIEGDADRDTVKRGVSDALRSINATR